MRGTAETRTLRRAVCAPLALVLALSACGSSGAANPAQTPSSPVTTAPTTRSTAAPTPTVRTSSAPTAAQIRARVAKAVAAIADKQPKNSISVAALNTKTGASFSWGSTSGHWTASVYKLFILEVLLHRNGGPLTGGQGANAISMIEQSDNVAGYSEFLAAGGRSGLVAGAEGLGLHHTVPGYSDPTFTTTGAPDLLILLENLVRRGPLTEDAREYALHLMRNVESDQRWGVGVIADKDTDFANKNGWLSIGPGNAAGENDGGRWAVNSVGVLTVGGQQVLMAVMSQHQPDYATGVRLVQSLARAVRPAIAS